MKTTRPLHRSHFDEILISDSVGGAITQRVCTSVNLTLPSQIYAILSLFINCVQIWESGTVCTELQGFTLPDIMQTGCYATIDYFIESAVSLSMKQALYAWPHISTTWNQVWAQECPFPLQESLSHSQQSANDMEHGMGNSKEGRRQLLVYTSVGVLLDMLYRFISTHIENKIQCTRLFLISNAHNAVYLWSTQIDEWAFQLAILRLFVFATKFLHCWLVQKTQDKEVRGKHCCMCKGDFISSTSSIQWQTGCSIVYLMTQRNSDLPAYFSSLLNVSVNKVNFFVLASR